MRDPYHNVKRRVLSYEYDGRPISLAIDCGNFVYFKESFWLGSGVKDCNGKEIFEGDMLYVCYKKDSRYGGKETVLSANFYAGAFWLDDFCGHLLTDDAVESLEIIGHIATEVTTNVDSR